MARAESNRRVFLIGFMGAGKTTVGHALARNLGWSFCDLDRIIEKQEQKTVAEIFAELGEAGFRAAESTALAELLREGGAQDQLVVALGGGTFAQPANREALMNANAVTVLLEAPLHELRQRCANDATVRPLAMHEARFAELFEQRRSAYSLARHHIQTSGKTVDQVAQEVARILAEAIPEVRK